MNRCWLRVTVAWAILSVVGTADISANGEMKEAIGDAEERALSHDVKGRMNVASTTVLPEPADAVLIRTKEWKWTS